MITKRASIGAIGGLIAGVWLFSASPASAQATQTEIKGRVKQGGVQTQEKWQSMTPAEQQKAKATGQTSAKKQQGKWQSATPQAQQQAKDSAAAAGQKTKGKWQSLPQ